MKFYYNDKLIRTSKTHEYKYAAMLNGKCIKCSTTKDGAQAELTSRINDCKRSIENSQALIKAIKINAPGYTHKEKRGTSYVKLGTSPFLTIEYAQINIDEMNNYINLLETTGNVVELEVRD